MNKFFSTMAAGLALVLLTPVANAGLIGLYTYDDPANLGKDSSAMGNNLVSGAWVAPAAASGLYGGAASFNGWGADLVSGSGTINGLPTGHASYTIASWINPNSAGAGGAGGIVGWGNYGNYSEVVAFRMNGAYSLHQYWWANDLTANPNEDLTSDTINGGWHFVAATYDASSGLNQIYIDGTLQAARYANNLNAGSANFAIGKTVWNEFFDGRMDNTAIFDQSLTAQQLQKIANNDFSEFKAVPEPESLLLLAIGLGGLVAVRRKVRK